MTQTSSTRANLLADLPQRLATICLGVPILWRLVWWYPSLRVLFFQGAHAAMCMEWAQMTGSPTLGIMIFPLVSVASVNCPEDALFFVLLLVGVFSFILTSGDASISNPKTQLQATAGVLLITIPNRSWLAVSQQSFAPTVSLLLTVWNCDTGALVAGRLAKAGNNNQPLPQPEWLLQASPNKSVQGLLGGFVAGVVTFCTLPWFWRFVEWLHLVPPDTVHELPDLTAWDRFRLGCALSVLALLGDLWESTLKRSFGVKDTGRLLPGHGGVLDRFDSSLLAVMLYAYKIQQK